MKNFILFFLLFFGSSGVAQVILTPNAIQDSIFNQLNLFPQEKIHLHTDRTMYVPGEKIWFKAYIVDAFSNQSPTLSQYAYIELINSSDSLVHRVMVCPDDFGLFHGNVFLSEEIPEGNYTLRAYTRYLENFSNDYFFKKNIRIGNLRGRSFDFAQDDRGNGGSGGNRGNRVVGASLAIAQIDYDVAFFPEGGNLVEGVIGRVAFKALNKQGASEIITGKIVDDAGNLIVSGITTVFAGMGSFAFGPQPGKEYFLITTGNSGKEKRFKLPAVQKACSVSSFYRDNKHFIQVKHTPGLSVQSLYLLVHCKGEVLYFAPWNLREEYISFSYNQLPSGVIQIVLFDTHLKPLSERLIFNKNFTHDVATIEFQTDKISYEKREKVIATIREVLSLTPSLPERGQGVRCSVAITDDADIAIDSLHTITSSLLLSSELRGFIESPGYYLQDQKYAAYALDHLMMTHGWRRYELSRALKGDYIRPAKEYELAKEISGSVKGLFRRPVANSEVSLISKDQRFQQTNTDADGNFRFTNLHYTDSASFFLLAKNQKGSENVEIVLNPETFPAPKYAPADLFFSSSGSGLIDLTAGGQFNQPAEGASDFIQKAEKRAQYDDDMRVINLEEVLVTARKIEKKTELRSQFALNAGSDRTIDREMIENRMPHAINIDQLFTLIPGARFQYNRLLGRYTLASIVPPLNSFSAPLYLIDGVTVDREIVDNLQPNEVESIDVFNSVGATIFGVRGANGVISITTRIGPTIDNNSSNNTISFVPLGYQQPIEFYSPKYDSLESKAFGVPDYRTTIFWKPDIIVDDNSSTSFEFYTSDFPTTYSVVIEGITNEGKIIRQVEKIEVQ
jgi:hypothetical protein